MNGTVEAIYITSTRHGPQALTAEAKIVAGAGIVGDRYFGAQARYPGQNVTLVELEEIERFNRESGAGVEMDGTRRNIVTRGIRLAALVGKEFTIGAVRLRGVELCEPCSTLGRNLASESMSAARVVEKFVHRAGLRAEALSNGTIKVGDAVVEGGRKGGVVGETRRQRTAVHLVSRSWQAPSPLEGEGVRRRRTEGGSLANLRARRLRWNMTDDERRLWSVLRRKNIAGFRFRRQQPIGPYIADFFCPAAKLVIELDGGQHAEECRLYKDEQRTRWLEARGYRVLRVWNLDLKRKAEDVYEAIYLALTNPSSGPSGHLPPQGGKEV